MAEYIETSAPKKETFLEITGKIEPSKIRIVAFGNQAFDRKRGYKGKLTLAETSFAGSNSDDEKTFLKIWEEDLIGDELSMGGSVINSVTIAKRLDSDCPLVVAPYFTTKEFIGLVQAREKELGIQFIPIFSDDIGQGRNEILAKILATDEGKKMLSAFLGMPEKPSKEAIEELEKSLTSLLAKEYRNIIMFEGYHSNDGRSLNILGETFKKMIPGKDIGFFTISGSFIHEFCDNDGRYSQSIVNAMKEGKLKVISGDKDEHMALFAKTEYKGQSMQKISKQIPGTLFIETDGAKGINLYIGGKIIHSPGIPFMGIPETTGCGDSVAGTFLWGIEKLLAKGIDLSNISQDQLEVLADKLEALADLANAVGCATCGTQQATLTKDEIESNLAITGFRKCFCDSLASEITKTRREFIRKEASTQKTQEHEIVKK